VADVARNIAIVRDAVEAKGEPWDPMRVGLTRAFFVTEHSREREEALERRMANRMRSLRRFAREVMPAFATTWNASSRLP
jgi:hypothetical protein